MIKIKSCIKTCPMFPAQWECVTEDEKIVYIRYRGGWFKVLLSPFRGLVLPGLDKWETLIDKTIGDGGIMSTSQMMGFTKGLLDFEGCEFTKNIEDEHEDEEEGEFNE